MGIINLRLLKMFKSLLTKKLFQPSQRIFNTSMPAFQGASQQSYGKQTSY